VNTYEVNRRQIWCVCRVKAVWSIPDCFSSSHNGALQKSIFLFTTTKKFHKWNCNNNNNIQTAKYQWQLQVEKRQTDVNKRRLCHLWDRHWHVMNVCWVRLKYASNMWALYSNDITDISSYQTTAGRRPTKSYRCWVKPFCTVCWFGLVVTCYYLLLLEMKKIRVTLCENAAGHFT